MRSHAARCAVEAVATLTANPLSFRSNPHQQICSLCKKKNLEFLKTTIRLHNARLCNSVRHFRYSLSPSRQHITQGNANHHNYLTYMYHYYSRFFMKFSTHQPISAPEIQEHSKLRIQEALRHFLQYLTRIFVLESPISSVC